MHAALAAAALLLGLHGATPASAIPAGLQGRAPSSAPVAEPISIPIHRRAGHDKRDRASFLRKVSHMKQKYGAPSSGGSKSRRADSTGSVTLTNYADSEFYGTVSVGTPAVNYNLVLDTGSSDMILAVENCNGCSKTTPGYTATTSTSASSSATPFDITYGSGSASGTLAQDAVSIAGYTHPNQVFAACDTMNNILDGDISGILGMGWSSIASSGAVPLVQALAENGTLPSQVFGFAFKSYAYDQLTSQTMAGGTLTVGSTDTSAYTGDINWIPISLPGGYWSIPLEGVTAGGADTGVTATEVVIDTGTTLIGMPAADVDAIYAQISEATATTLDGQSGYYEIPCDLDVNVTMTFGGISYPIPSSSFNAGATDTSGTTCLGAIFALETTSTLSVIIGDAFLTGVYSAYRFDSTPAVGFAKLGSGGTAVSGSSSKASSEGGSSSPAPGMGSLLSMRSVGVAALVAVMAVVVL